MQNQSNLARRLSVLLFHEWDPIGVRFHRKLDNEYDRYANEIVARFSETSDVEEIFDYLKQACQKRMCMGLDKSNWAQTRQVAENILYLFAIKDRWR